jgi:uncharacterized protein YsxB (DUF464 family)
MITITLKHDENRTITGFRISGHSGYSEEGSDIVCSAVSALAQTALLGLMEYLPGQVEYQMDDGFLSVQVLKDSPQGQVILKTMVLGFRQIVQQYGQYVILHL